MSTKAKSPDGADTTPDDGADPARHALAARLDLGATPGLQEALLAARGRDLVLDGGEVQHLGAAALQVLIAARRGWEEDGRALTLDGPSDALAEGLARMGATIEAITVEARP